MSTIKKTELKVNINCERCKKDVLHGVTKLSGINQVSVEAKKEISAVIGDVDPVMIVKQVRKAGKHAEIISVEPPKPPEPKSPWRNALFFLRVVKIASLFPLAMYPTMAVATSFDAVYVRCTDVFVKICRDG